MHKRNQESIDHNYINNVIIEGMNKKKHKTVFEIR